jgi:adenylate kinase family enzyme
VSLLIKGMIAAPSKNYLIDGFPRQLDQAQLFEQQVGECQRVIFYEVSEEILVQRCQHRAAASAEKRSDDNMETLLERFKTFNDSSRPVVDYYDMFGKVHRIDASSTVKEVYHQTKQALLPEIFSILGPRGAGKTKLGSALAERTNMEVMNFCDFLKTHSLSDASDEDKTSALINHMVGAVTPRYLLEDFPQNEFQAKYFVKNCTTPSRVFVLNCQKDVCQERFLELGPDHHDYIPSSLLSQRIAQYTKDIPKVQEYLKTVTKVHELDSEQPFDKAFLELAKIVEPVVVHVRAAGSSNEMRANICKGLIEDEGFVELNRETIISAENQRMTAMG